MRVIEGSLKRRTDPNGCEITFRTHDVREADEIFSKINGKPVRVTIEPERKKRSLDANAYMWTLCEKIADKIHVSRGDVYRRAIRERGAFEDMAIQTIALGDFIRMWQANGIGWLVDVFDSTLPRCKRVRCYFGSSVYDSKQMSRLVDYIVDEAKEIGIETMTPDELKELIDRWEQ